MANIIVIIVAHGSPSAEGLKQTRLFQRELAARCPHPVRLCYLELAEPDLASGLQSAAIESGQDGMVVVFPLLLGAASHQKNDLPAAIHWARAQLPHNHFLLAAPLQPHAHLIRLLDVRIQEALRAQPDSLAAEESVVLIVARGSSDAQSNSEIARSAHLLFEKRAYRRVEYAFQAVARPTIREGIRRAHCLEAQQLIVAPYILFNGFVEQEIMQVARAEAKTLSLPLVEAPPLGVHPLLMEVAEQRLQECLAGQVNMTCDLCKYRLPMAGYEHQVGKTQTTHHLHREKPPYE